MFISFNRLYLFGSNLDYRIKLYSPCYMGDLSQWTHNYTWPLTTVILWFSGFRKHTFSISDIEEFEDTHMLFVLFFLFSIPKQTLQNKMNLNLTNLKLNTELVDLHARWVKQLYIQITIIITYHFVTVPAK